MLSILLLTGGSSGAGQAKKKGSEPWYYKLARILGVDRAPVGLKGPASAKPGELWICPVVRGEPRRLTEGSDYSSPVFQPGGKFIFALRGEQLVRVAIQSGASAPVRSLSGVMKLVGFDSGHPDMVLALFNAGEEANGRNLDVTLVSVRTGERQVIAKGQSADSEEVEAVLGWQRQYGKVSVRPQGGQIVVSGIDVVEIPVTDCRNASCGQPSYSPDLRQVVFIRNPTPE